MDSKTQIAIITDFFEKRKEVLIKKGEDYNGENVLKIFQTIGNAENRTPEQVILSEVLKKALRLTTLLGSYKQPNFESIEDNIMDLANYTDLLLCASKHTTL